MKKLSFVFSLSLLFSLSSLQAQLLDRVLKRTTDKLARSAEDMLVEKASDALTRALTKRMEREIDKVLMAEYERQDSVAAAQGDPPRYPDYGAFLKSMNRAADVPEAYEFDLQLVGEMSQGKEKPQDMIYYLQKEGNVTGFETIEKNGNRTIIVLDLENDLSVIYTEEKGKRTAQALPSMTSFAQAAYESAAEEAAQDYEVKATGKKKKVAGYRCESYEITHEEGTSTCYLTQELDVSWSDAFGKMMAQMVSEQSYAQFAKLEDGMVLESINYDEKSKEENHWVTTEVKLESYRFDNSQYEFEDFTAMTDEEEED
ncbi:MAG: DUF4412 domain-containing protein [Bacteroidota bacterium]